MKIHFLFIDPDVVQNLCDLLNLWNTKGFKIVVGIDYFF